MTDGHASILLVNFFIWLLLNLFASWTLKFSGEGAYTISGGKMLHALTVRGRKACRYASVLALSVWYEYICDGSTKLVFVL